MRNVEENVLFVEDVIDLLEPNDGLLFENFDRIVIACGNVSRKSHTTKRARAQGLEVLKVGELPVGTSGRGCRVCGR